MTGDLVRSRLDVAHLTSVAVRSLRHRVPDDVEVVFVDSEHAESETLTPARRVLDERKLVDQRADRRLRAGQELDPATPGLELRIEVLLVDLVVDDPADRRERLQPVAVGVVRLR